MARDTLLGFPAHTLPYRRGKFITLSTASVFFIVHLSVPAKKDTESVLFAARIAAAP